MSTVTSQKKTTAARLNESSLKCLWIQLTQNRAWHPKNVRVSKGDLARLLSMLKMLLENGLSLQKSLESLSRDRGCRKHRKMLIKLLGRVASGETLSRSMAAFPKVYSTTMLHHIALAEASGTLVDSLGRIVEQLEESTELRRKLIQKLSYPALVIFAGSGLVTFMLTTVVPQFEGIYSESKVSLPWVTSVVTAASRNMLSYFWVFPLLLVSLFLAYRTIRGNQSSSIAFDGLLLKVPVVGPFLKDISAMEFLRSALVLSEAGFVPLDAITQAAKSVPNRFARQLLQHASQSVGQGKKISVAMRDVEFLFPSAIPQLVMVGEQSGDLTLALHGSCAIVKKQMEQRLTAALGTLEPVLTIGLAGCVGWIVLAIYMPMFHMFDVLDFQ